MEDIEQQSENLTHGAAEANRVSICLNLKKAARATSQVLDSFLVPVGLKSSQLGLLNQISLLGSPTMTALAEASVSDRTTVTRNLQPLERDGLVQVIEGRDRRVREITLTDKGRELLAKALPLREQAELVLAQHLGDNRWRELLATLEFLTRSSMK